MGKKEDEDFIIEIVSRTFDDCIKLQRQNIFLKAENQELKEKLVEIKRKEEVLHEMRIEQGAL